MTRPLFTDARRDAPATHRNRDAILAHLNYLIGEPGTVLEIGSGTGQHAVYFARQLRGIAWWPSDPAPDARASIDAWAEATRAPTVAPALDIDVTAADWPSLVRPPDRLVAIVAVNVLHIAPWAVTLGLLAGAGTLLTGGAPLIVYGPFYRDGQTPAPSNVAFDGHLRTENARWGLRVLEEVAEAARAHGLRLEKTVEMPANNTLAVFRPDP